MTVQYADLREKWEQDPEFQKEFEAVRPEFGLARQLIEAQARAGLSQTRPGSTYGHEPTNRRSS